MTDLTEEVARALFEAEWGSANTWESECDLNGGSDSREYWLKSAQAAIAIVLERAAEVARERANYHANNSALVGWTVTRGRQDEAARIAAAILALSPNRSREG